MERDLIYYFNKNTFIRRTLGEIQSDFNMSFVIDGTKDSDKVIVRSFDPQEIEPMTIVWHGRTNTWWVATHDKVERYVNEDDTFIYTHTLDLLGAIELTNARDLTDCGFNENTYSIGQFINRLFQLSSFEYNIEISSVLLLSKKVDFVKTFENYTLLAALREFLSAYNCCAKLTFVQNYSSGNIIIDHAILHIISKAGNYSLEQHDESEFYGVKEIRAIDKDNYGTTVVSNAENVISTQFKTFPSAGNVKLSGTEWDIRANTAVLRLPSNVFKGNWIKLTKHSGSFKLVGYVGNFSFESQYITPTLGEEDIDIALRGFIDLVKAADDREYGDGRFFNPFYQALQNDKDLIAEINAASTITLYNGNKLVPYYGANNDQVGEIIIEKGDNVPYLAKARSVAHNLDGLRELVFCDKETKNLLPKTWQGIQWERGSNIISGFEMFFDSGDASSITKNIAVDNFMYTDLQKDNTYELFVFENSYGLVGIKLDDSLVIRFKDLLVKVNYVPMTDLKVKIDNTRDKKDIQLYNQNGRLTDCVALSKLLNSYAKEISSDSITKYGTYYNYNEVPKVSSIVWFGNDPYVISNVSLTFTQNEKSDNDYGYFIDAEFTMSKYVSTKSLMVNPNTNIRDYGIPQNFNVKRKQVYRDYYELTYGHYEDANQETPYLPKENVFNFGHTTNENDSFIGIIKLGYNSQIEGSYRWYYQLETTNYYLNKMFYVVLDFNDNNIIGYGSQNVFSGFDISRIFRNLTDIVNTPISYTDNLGRVENIEILLCTREQTIDIYNAYQVQEQGAAYTGSLYNYSVFIPQDIYSGAENNHTIKITENGYRKDALEIPVFEYACQINDTNDVFIGDNILTQHENCLYFYTYVIGNNLTQDNILDTQSIQAIQSPVGFRVNNGVDIQYDPTYNALRVRIYATQTYYINDDSWNNANQQAFTLGSDYAIFRHALNLNTMEEIVDLVFIAKKVPFDHLTLDKQILTLEINHYKLN